jgi:hypothetical protein
VSPFQYFSSNIHCYEIKAAAEREGFLGFPITFQFFPSCCLHGEGDREGDPATVDTFNSFPVATLD